MVNTRCVIPVLTFDRFPTNRTSARLSAKKFLKLRGRNAALTLATIFSRYLTVPRIASFPSAGIFQPFQSANFWVGVRHGLVLLQKVSPVTGLSTEDLQKEQGRHRVEHRDYSVSLRGRDDFFLREFPPRKGPGNSTSTSLLVEEDGRKLVER